jgi:hypothetical protein
MDIKELENWLWDIASILRGQVEAYHRVALYYPNKPSRLVKVVT